MNSFVKKIVTVAATAALTLSSAAALAAAPLQLGVRTTARTSPAASSCWRRRASSRLTRLRATRRKSRISPTTSTTSR